MKVVQRYSWKQFADRIPEIRMAYTSAPSLTNWSQFNALKMMSLHRFDMYYGVTCPLYLMIMT